ncbi:MAG: TauD/TfdA family dioxygenase [Novosphingobium sp.]|nr:TauD/TfdA family dioxygenase [Novosphingobium sp.]
MRLTAQFETAELTPRIGTEIKASKADLLAGDFREEIRDLLEQRGILLFRELDFTDEEQRAFSATIGEVFDQGEDGIFRVTLDRSITPQADYLEATTFWHIDAAHTKVPTRASILTARVLIEDGGRWTEFANTYAAYQDLSPEKKQWAERQKVVHSQVYLQSAHYTDPTPELAAHWLTHPEQVHPLVWTHRSGRKSLLLGRNAGRIVGMSEEEGADELAELLDWSGQPQFIYRHHWTVGDMIIWDNTGVMHRVEPYRADAGRLLSRCTLVGEEPVA